jgi:hypothetical protein
LILLAEPQPGRLEHIMQFVTIVGDELEIASGKAYADLKTFSFFLLSSFTLLPSLILPKVMERKRMDRVEMAGTQWQTTAQRARLGSDSEKYYKILNDTAYKAVKMLPLNLPPPPNLSFESPSLSI